MKKTLFLALALVQLTACSAKVGSDEWCQDLKDKDKAQWTASETKDYAKHCLFK